MPLPMSGNAIKKLGERLAASTVPAEADLEQLEEIVQCHAEILTVARMRLADLADADEWGRPAITHRAKTTQTIVQKLQRQPGMVLARMQDLAGIRLVGAFSLATQDQLVDEIKQRFPADPREPRVIDRRVTPSWGYRAVHVVVSLDGLTVEVQVRTQRQDLWANVTERLGDTLGRGIRYGEDVEVPSAYQERVELLRSELGILSDQLYAIESDPSCPPQVATESGFESTTAAAVGAFMQRVLPNDAK